MIENFKLSEDLELFRKTVKAFIDREVAPNYERWEKEGQVSREVWRKAGEAGGTLPAVLNAANEVAVAAFLDRKVRFPRIWQLVEEVMGRHANVAHPDLDAILRADQWARAEATAAIGRKS